MDLFLSCMFVLLMCLLVLFYPAFILIISFYVYEKILSKSKTWLFVFRFCIGYLGISIVAVGIYLFISYLNEVSGSTNTRTDIIYIFTASAAFVAPVAVLVGFNLWKKQHFLTTKIEVIGNLKAVLVEQLDVLNEFWREDNVRNIRNAVTMESKIECRQNYENMIRDFEGKRKKSETYLKNIVFILE
jgi:hypothetical protein